MVIIGTILFLVGAVAELVDYLRGAWPTAITWILMGLGLLSIAVGLTRAGSVWRRVAWAVFFLFVAGIGFAWFLG